MPKAAFTKAAVRRAVSAVASCGLIVREVRITRDGEMRILTGDDQAASLDPFEEFEREEKAREREGRA